MMRTFAVYLCIAMNLRIASEGCSCPFWAVMGANTNEVSLLHASFYQPSGNLICILRYLPVRQPLIWAVCGGPVPQTRVIHADAQPALEDLIKGPTVVRLGDLSLALGAPDTAPLGLSCLCPVGQET